MIRFILIILEALILYFLETVDAFIWGPGLLTLLMGTGAFLTLRLHFLPWKNLSKSLHFALSPKARSTVKDGGISPFSALMTALASTIGTGNIVGVSTALVLGGPGALIWMEISALLGLATKYAECMLAAKYRRKNKLGEMIGGSMYPLQERFPFHSIGRILAILFAVFAVLASFGIGNMTQANSVSEALYVTFGVSPTISGIVLMVLTFIILIGGIRSISKISSALVPIMSILYLIGGTIVILGNFQNLPSGIIEIFRLAFSPKAAAAGAGETILASMQRAAEWGIARGVFSNEAGMGSATFTAAAASSEDPVEIGYLSMTGVFFDTTVICTITGLAIVASGVLGITDSNGDPVEGAALTIAAFETVLGPFGGKLIAIGITLFAFSTIIGWAYNGEKALEYLLPKLSYRKIYRVFYTIAVLVGATIPLEAVWTFSNIMNGLMAGPNLICLLALSGEIARDTFAEETKGQKKKMVSVKSSSIIFS